jgi:methionine sulfoxide reductase heme-binding subunit
MLATLTWHITRASGVIAYALLTGSTLWGLGLSTRVHGKRPPRPWMLDVHRMLGGLAVVLTALHMLSIAFDNFVDYRVVDLFVPFAIGWKTVGVAAGIVAMYLLVAVEMTSVLRNRQRISQSAWRRVHYLSFLLFVLSSAHFIAVGTDAASPFIVGIILVAVVSVIALTAYRIHKVVSATERTNRPPPGSLHSREVTRATF